MFTLSKRLFRVNLPVMSYPIKADKVETVAPSAHPVAYDTADWLVVKHVHGRIPGTVLAIRGDLDASTYEAVIAKVQELVQMNEKKLIVDLSEVPAITTAGLVALHNLARLINGKPATETVNGWGALHEMQWDREQGLPIQPKLLAPQPAVVYALTKSGMNLLFQVCENLDTTIETLGYA
ncbi:MAG: STAS domain-containing protein [Chloroflexota bacterium]